MMTDIDIRLPATLDFDAVPTVIEEVCANLQLVVTMKGTLKKYPDCIHWHFKNGKRPGVLEVTWWPRPQSAKSNELWLSVHGNRRADWIDQLMPELRDLIGIKLAALTGT